MGVRANCLHCGGKNTVRQSRRGGRPVKYCSVRCRMAAMRARKQSAGLIPRAPWTDAGRAQYYERAATRNKYPSPLSRRSSGFSMYEEYMRRWHPDEWALLPLRRNAGPDAATSSVTPAGDLSL